MQKSSVSIQSKLPGTKTTIFTQMTLLANEHNAINLAQGFPNFDVSPELIGLVNKKMKAGFNQYAPMMGALALREQVSIAFENKYGVNYNPDTEITITAGATQAIYSAITAVIRDGDEVIIIEPAFDIYAPGVRLCGGIPKFYKMEQPDYHIEWSALKKLITHNTKMIIINSPHNPTSTVLSENDMKNLEKLTKGTDIVIVSDEVYENLIFDGLQHQSVCKYPELLSRSFLVGSFGKTFHVTGWKTGFCIAPEAMMKEFRRVHQNVVFAGNHPIQLALADFMKKPDNYIHLPEFYQEKRDYFLSLMKGSKFEALPALGTYFLLFRYGKISQENEMDFAVRLTKEHKVATIPMSYFYNDGSDFKTLRVCFAKTNETLEKTAEILCKI